jgi:hypothetical protein
MFLGQWITVLLSHCITSTAKIISMECRCQVNWCEQLRLTLTAIKICCRWRNSAAENVMYSKDWIVVFDNNWQYTYFPAARKRKFWRSCSLLRLSGDCMYDVAKSTAVPKCSTLCYSNQTPEYDAHLVLYAEILEIRCMWCLDKYGNSNVFV